MIRILKKIKQYRIYKYSFLLVFSTFYEIFWQYIINFKSKILYFYFKTTNFKQNYFNLSNTPLFIVSDDSDYKKIAFEINNELTNEKIEKAKNEFKLKFDSSKDIKDYSINLTNYISDDLMKKIINFSTNVKNIKTASEYLKVLPYLAKVKLYMNIPLKNKTPKASMLWHRDDFGYKSLDLFLAIRKVDNLNGPLHYVNKNSLNKIFLQVPDEKKEKIIGERNKHSLEHFDKFIKKENTTTFVGNSGDGLWIDSFRVYHRGGHCIENERYMLRLSYQTSDNTRSNSLDDNCYYYDKSIRKVNIKKILEKHYFFGHKSSFISKLNLANKLIFLYRLVAIKIRKFKLN